MTDPNQFDENKPGGVPPYGSPQYGAPQYGAPQGGPQYGGVEPDNYLVWAILTTIFCCLPFGIVSIVKSTSVGKLWAMGDQAGAQRASEDAKKWAMISAGVGLFVIVIYVILMVAGVLSFEANTSTY